MKHILSYALVPLLILIPTCLLGQNVDSLKKEIERLSRDSEGKVQLMDTYQALGKYYSSAQDPEAALENFAKGLEVARIIKNQERVFEFLNTMGTIYFFPMDDYANSVGYLLEAREVGEMYASEKDQARNLSQLAEVFIALGDFEQALQFQLDALRISEVENDTTGLAYSYRNLGTIYWNQENYQEALENFENALRLGQYSRNPRARYAYTASVGAAYLELGDLEKANDYIETSRKIADSADYDYGVAYSEGALGNIYFARQEFDLAITALDNAIRLFEEIGIRKEALGFRIQQAEVYTQKGNPRKALEILEDVEPSVDEIQALSLKREIYENRSEAFEKLNMIPEAFEAYKQFIIYKDSLVNEETVAEMAKIEHQYKVLKKDDEIDQMKKSSQSSQKQFYFIALFLGILLLLVVIYLIYLRNKTLHETNRLLASKNEAIRMQNDRLASSNEELRQFAHVTSHDLREPLRSISSFTTLLKKRYQDKLDDQANEFINYIISGVNRMDTLLSDLLAYSVVGIGKHEYKSVNINHIITSIIEGLHREKNTQGAKISIQNLPAIIANPPQMQQLFQHLLDNAIKFRSPDRKPEIKISARKSENGYLFSVADNGIGMDEAYKDKIFGLFLRLHHKKTQYKGTGIGLSICKKIVEQHKGKIWIESQLDKGTTVYFVLPESPISTTEETDHLTIPEVSETTVV